MTSIEEVRETLMELPTDEQWARIYEMFRSQNADGGVDIDPLLNEAMSRASTSVNMAVVAQQDDLWINVYVGWEMLDAENCMTECHRGKVICPIVMTLGQNIGMLIDPDPEDPIAHYVVLPYEKVWRVDVEISEES